MLTQPLLGRDVYDVLAPSVRDGRRERRRELGTDFVLQEIARGRSLGRLEVPRSVMAELAHALGPTADEVNDGDDIERAPAWATSEVQATLHEVMWRESKAFARRGGEGAADEPVAWKDTVLGAVGQALEEARSANVSHAGGIHLLLGLVSEPGGAAATLLRKQGVNSAALVDRLRSDPLWARAASPHTPLVEQLTMTGGLEGATPWMLRWAPAFLRRGAAKRSRYRGPVMNCLEYEMARQAIRMASRSVTSVHGILAISSLRDQLSATGRRLSTRVSALNLAIDVLPAHHDLLAAVEAVSAATDEESEVLSQEAAAVFWVPGVRWGRRMSEALERSIALADRLNHPEVGTSHLLFALLDDEDGASYRLVASAGGTPREIRSRIETSLSAG